MRSHWLICLLVLVLISCSSSESPPPTFTESVVVPVEETQTEIAEVPATETSNPENTSTPTLASTEPPNTQIPIPTQPQTGSQKPSAIIAKVTGGPNSFLLLGGSQMEDWISAGDVADSLSVNTKYQLHSAYEDQGWISGQSITHEHICNQYFITANQYSFNQSTIGVEGDWQVRPRVPLEIPIDNEVYLTAVAAWQVEQAPSMPIAAIKKIWKVDVEGNGTDEVFINATRFAEPTGHNVEPRDYSVVLMRTVVGSEVATVELVGDYYSEVAVNQFPSTYHLEFIGDLNGDGRMEVVVGVSRWEGTGVMVFEIDVDQVRLVLSVMCSL